jgi:hypothetical protein
MSKKGQAAMEFLMTYGWAIVVVLAAIGALAYFGVLSPSKLLPDKTTFPTPIQSVDSSAKVTLVGNYVEVAFRNNKGSSITIPAAPGTYTMTPAASVIGCGTYNMSGTYQGATLLNTTQISNGDSFLLRWTCLGTTTAKVGDKFHADITFAYINVDTTQSLTEAGTAEGKYS